MRSTNLNKPRIIVGISGSSGVIYGIRLLEILKTLSIETHLVVTKAAQLTLSYETEMRPAALKALADITYPISDIAAPIASGSFKTLGMIIAPCSMKSLAEIAHGISGNLLTRAADVVLKERRRLVLIPRESPLHMVHLQNMLQVTQMGGIICPPVPAFYHKPESVLELVNESLGRVLDLFDIDSGFVRRWGESDGRSQSRATE